MRAQLLSLRDVSPAQVRGWQELADRAAEPNPFHEPALVLPAVRHLGGDDVRVLWIGDSDPVLCLPVQLTRRWRGLPRPVLSTWRHNYSFLGTPLVDPDVVDDAISMMVESFSDLAPGLISLDWVGAGGVVLPSLERRLASAGLPWRPHAAHVRATIERTSVADGVPRQLSASRRKSLRRRRRRLAESAGGELALRVDDDDASVERFLAMEASGWKGRTGTAMAARAADAEFFRATCREFAARGRLQILTLGTAQTDVAMQCNVTAGDVVFCFKVAYAEAFAADSPGVQLELDAVDHYLRERTDVAWMDSCAEPDNDLINALWPDRRAIETVVIATGGAVDRTLVRSLPALSAARRRVSQIMQERGRRPASERDPQDAAPSA